MIPPPIVQSTYITAPKALQNSTVIEKPLALEDRQSELEADLQFLLDAQAEGLLEGLEGGVPDDQTSTGSTTPTAQSVRSASARRQKKPARKKPGLRSARKGIYNGIIALSTVKREELHVIDAEAQEKEDTLAHIDEWAHKHAGLQKAARSADGNEEAVRAQRLRQEADALQADINNVELQLSDMKARHRKLLRQVAAVENSVQAKLASYTSSLGMLEVEVQKFLSLRPAGGSDSRPTSSDGKTSMWQLPPKRRTLEMAREQWTADRDAILHQRQYIEHERSALDEGAAVWKGVVAHVTDFEKRMRAEMANLSMSSSHSAWEDPPPAQEQDNSGRLNELLGHLQTVLEHLETQFNLAEDRDWRLLIAAIGAELDALRQGKAILQNVLGVTFTPDTLHNGNVTENLVDTEPSANGSSGAHEDGNEIHELDKSFDTALHPARQSSAEDSETDTDDPDPELLFSRRDLGDE